MSRFRLFRVVIGIQAAAFAGMLAIILLDELLDLPHWFIGAPVTPANWPELVTESSLLLLLAGLTLSVSVLALRRIEYLEGFVRICSFCKRVDLDGKWVQVERFVSDRSDAVFSHGLCPDCIHEHYGEFFDAAHTQHTKQAHAQ